MTHDEMLTSEHPGTGPSPRTRPWWVGVAAASAGVLAAASVGYAFGQAGEPTTSTTPAIALSSNTPGGPNTDGSRALGPPVASGSGDTRVGIDMMPYGYGRIVFTASGLSSDAGSSTAWGYDPGAVFSRQTATRAAAAFGFDGEPTLVDGSWIVGSNDGTGPTLQLMPDGMASLNFWDPTMDPYGCAVAVPEGDGMSVGAPDGSSANSGGSTDPVKPPVPDCTKRGPNAPQGDAAVAQVKDLLTALGVDSAGYEFEAMDYGTSDSSYVIAYQVVDNQRSGATWSVSFVGRQIQSAYGGLAPLVSLGTYDVVSAATAVDRLSDPRYGMGFWGGPMPYYAMDSAVAGPAMKSGDDPAVTSGDTVAAPRPTLPPTVQPGDQFSWPVQTVTITKGRLGVALYTQADGSTVLIPTYELSDGDGSTWSVVAVDDASLDFTS